MPRTANREDPKGLSPPSPSTGCALHASLWCRPAGYALQAGRRTARYSQSAVYSTWEGCVVPPAVGGVGAGLSAWALRTSTARG